MKLPIVERLEIASSVLTDETIRDHCREDIKNAARIIEALAEALEPFARDADGYDPDEGDSELLVWDSKTTIGDLRRARAALARVAAAHMDVTATRAVMDMEVGKAERDRDAALARAEKMEAALINTRNMLHETQDIHPMWEGGVRGSSRGSLQMVIAAFKDAVIEMLAAIDAALGEETDDGVR
jgi:hypothetical protein